MDMTLNPELFRYKNMTSKSIVAAPTVSAHPIRLNTNHMLVSSPHTAHFNRPRQEDSPLLHAQYTNSHYYNVASLPRDSLLSYPSTSTNHTAPPSDFFQPPSQGYRPNFNEADNFTSQMIIPGKSIHELYVFAIYVTVPYKNYIALLQNKRRVPSLDEVGKYLETFKHKQ